MQTIVVVFPLAALMSQLVMENRQHFAMRRYQGTTYGHEGRGVLLFAQNELVSVRHALFHKTAYTVNKASDKFELCEREG